VKIGIPREIKTLEGRVGLIPAACSSLVEQGHEVYVETAAGLKSGYSDADFTAVGARVLADPGSVFGVADLIVKVKEPQETELARLREGQLLFCFLHLAAMPDLARQLAATGCTAIGWETVTDAQGRLPILAPMSEIAGRLAVQIGTTLLHQYRGGRGLLLGGLPGAEKGRVVIIGGGSAGTSAAIMAAGLGANVIVFDLNRERLIELQRIGPNVTALYPYPDSIAAHVAAADLLVGAVLRPGERSPRVVSAEAVRTMNEGSVVVDISVDQGGCIETTRPTTYAEPTYVWNGVIHFGVTNMPGAVPRTAVQALSAVLIPYVNRLAAGRWEAEAGLVAGINVRAGEVLHPGVKAVLN
jgi:alanine dehydrogenase